MIVVHHLEKSRSQRVLWLLEELGLEYDVRNYARDPATMLAPPSLQAVHPLGKSPVLTDGERVMAESGAILEYLVSRYGHGRLRPAEDTEDWLRYTYWMHFAEGSAMPPLLLKLIFGRLPSQPAPFFVKPILRSISDKMLTRLVHPQLERQLDYMEAEMTGRDWFAGAEFSAADIQMSFPIEAAEARAGLDARRPMLMDWLQRIRARPAYRQAIERGGPYSLLG
jgi:glutathione S-transferase